jgi:hypothetical protein
MPVLLRSILAGIVAIGVFTVVLQANDETPGDASSAQTQCVVCHTNVKGLIRLSWEVEKLRPKPARSAETSGEG